MKSCCDSRWIDRFAGVPPMLSGWVVNDNAVSIE